VSQDHEAQLRHWESLTRRIADDLTGLTGVAVALDRRPSGVPCVGLTWLGLDAGRKALTVARALKDGEPSVHLVENEALQGRLAVNPVNLSADEATALVRRVRETCGPS
jgi:hypothetical protein